MNMHHHQHHQHQHHQHHCHKERQNQIPNLEIKVSDSLLQLESNLSLDDHDDFSSTNNPNDYDDDDDISLSTTSTCTETSNYTNTDDNNNYYNSHYNNNIEIFNHVQQDEVKQGKVKQDEELIVDDVNNIIIHSNLTPPCHNDTDSKNISHNINSSNNSSKDNDENSVYSTTSNKSTSTNFTSFTYGEQSTNSRKPGMKFLFSDNFSISHSSCAGHDVNCNYDDDNYSCLSSHYDDNDYDNDYDNDNYSYFQIVNGYDDDDDDNNNNNNGDDCCDCHYDNVNLSLDSSFSESHGQNEYHHDSNNNNQQHHHSHHQKRNPKLLLIQHQQSNYTYQHHNNHHQQQQQHQKYQLKEQEKQLLEEQIRQRQQNETLSLSTTEEQDKLKHLLNSHDIKERTSRHDIHRKHLLNIVHQNVIKAETNAMTMKQMIYSICNDNDSSDVGNNFNKNNDNNNDFDDNMNQNKKDGTSEKNIVHDHNDHNTNHNKKNNSNLNQRIHLSFVDLPILSSPTPSTTTLQHSNSNDSLSLTNISNMSNASSTCTTPETNKIAYSQERLITSLVEPHCEMMKYSVYNTIHSIDDTYHHYYRDGFDDVDNHYDENNDDIEVDDYNHNKSSLCDNSSQSNIYKEQNNPSLSSSSSSFAIERNDELQEQHDQLCVKPFSMASSCEKACIVVDTSVSTNNSDARHKLQQQDTKQTNYNYYSPIRQIKQNLQQHYSPMRHSNITDNDTSVIDNDNYNHDMNAFHGIRSSSHHPIPSAIITEENTEDQFVKPKRNTIPQKVWNGNNHNNSDLYHLVSPIMAKRCKDHHHHYEWKRKWKLQHTFTIFKRLKKVLKLICQLLGMISLTVLILLWIVHDDTITHHHQGEKVLDNSSVHYYWNEIVMFKSEGRNYLKRMIASFMVNHVLNVTDIADIVKDFTQYQRQDDTMVNDLEGDSDNDVLSNNSENEKGICYQIHFLSRYHQNSS